MYLGLAQLGKQCPDPKSPHAIRRWIVKGQRARSGKIVRLRGVRIGSKYFSTLEWLHEYFAELAREDLQVQPDVRQERARVTQSRADAEAEAILAADGM